MSATKIYIQDSPITILTVDKEDYISLTDMAHSQLQEHIIFKWMSLKNTIEYLGEWETLYNPDFNYTEFGTIRNMAGSNNFVLSTKLVGLTPKWSYDIILLFVFLFKHLHMLLTPCKHSVNNRNKAHT